MSANELFTTTAGLNLMTLSAWNNTINNNGGGSSGGINTINGRSNEITAITTGSVCNLSLPSTVHINNLSINDGTDAVNFPSASTIISLSSQKDVLAIQNISGATATLEFQPVVNTLSGQSGELNVSGNTGDVTVSFPTTVNINTLAINDGTHLANYPTSANTVNKVVNDVLAISNISGNVATLAYMPLAGMGLVDSVTGTANEITVSPTTGACVVSLPSSVNITTANVHNFIITDGANNVDYPTSVNTFSGAPNDVLAIQSITGSTAQLAFLPLSGMGLVDSVIGTANQITVSPTTGNCVVSLPNDVTINNNLTVTSAVEVLVGDITVDSGNLLVSNGTIEGLNIDANSIRLTDTTFGTTYFEIPPLVAQPPQNNLIVSGVGTSSSFKSLNNLLHNTDGNITINDTVVTHLCEIDLATSISVTNLVACANCTVTSTLNTAGLNLFEPGTPSVVQSLPIIGASVPVQNNIMVVNGSGGSAFQDISTLFTSTGTTIAITNNGDNTCNLDVAGSLTTTPIYGFIYNIQGAMITTIQDLDLTGTSSNLSATGIAVGSTSIVLNSGKIFNGNLLLEYSSTQPYSVIANISGAGSAIYSNPVIFPISSTLSAITIPFIANTIGGAGNVSFSIAPVSTVGIFSVDGPLFAGSSMIMITSFN